MNLIYFSPVAWDSYEQRPHYFVRDFLASGGASATWINPYPARLPSWRDLARVDLRAAPLTLERPPGLTVIDPGGLPVDPLPAGASLNRRIYWQALIDRLAASASASRTIIGIGRPTELALAALEGLDHARSFYDAMDDFPEFYRGRSRQATARVEDAIARRVTRILAASDWLVAKFAATGKVTLLANAYDMPGLPPYTPRAGADPHFGFIGCLGGWFDWALVDALARAVRPAPVTLVGPLATKPRAPLPPNVRLLPACSQPESMAHLGAFTAGLIPFVRNNLTAGVDPIKYYQYRGAGLPVLSTTFGSMAGRGASDGTFFLDGSEGLPAAVDAAARYAPTPESVAGFRAEHSWAARFSAARLWTT